MRIRYRELPEGLDAEIRQLVTTWRHLLPGWVDTLTISYDDTDSDNYAGASAMFDQRTAHIVIYPLFWSLDQRGREVTLIHEIGHVLMAPLDQCVETITQQRPKRALAEKLWSDAAEGFVNDFASLAWCVREKGKTR